MITFKDIARELKANLMKYNQQRIDIVSLEKSLELTFEYVIKQLKAGERFRLGRIGILKIIFKKPRKVVDNLGTYKGVKNLPKRPVIHLTNNKELEKELLEGYEQQVKKIKKISK